MQKQGFIEISSKLKSIAAVKAGWLKSAGENRCLSTNQKKRSDLPADRYSVEGETTDSRSGRRITASEAG